MKTKHSRYPPNIQKLFLVLLVAAVAIIVLFVGRSCRQDDEGTYYVHTGSIEVLQEGPINEYVWLTQGGLIQLYLGDAEYIYGLVMYDELIYYLYVEFSIVPATFEVYSASIQLKGINELGIIENAITIPMEQWDSHIIGFDIRNSNEISIVMQVIDWETGQGVLYYRKYDFAGNLLRDVELLQSGTDWIALEVHFDGNNAIAIFGINPQFETSFIFWDENLIKIKEASDVSNVFTFTGNNTFLHLNDYPFTLQEINLSTGELIQEHSLPLLDIINIHLAEASSNYDYYIVTTEYIYGYILETEVLEPIINFFESSINLSPSSYLVFTTDGRIVISRERAGLDFLSFTTELAILSPVQRTRLEDRDYIILGGFRLSPLIHDYVMDFNRDNPDLQIVIHDYWDVYDVSGYGQAVDRFHLEIIAGNLPDIIVFEGIEAPNLSRARESLVRQGALMDLYQFIDADPELNREDFFENILSGVEDSDGGLPMIGNWLAITTMITTNPSIQADNWTFDEFLTHMEQSIEGGNFEPLGRGVTRVRFLDTILEYMGHIFVDGDAGISHFESDNFIRLLELFIAIPAIEDKHFFDLSPNFHALSSGGQIVDLIANAGYQDLLNMDGSAPPPFSYIGLPGESDGTHSIEFLNTYSIFNNSQHAEAAWRFIRTTLFSDTTQSHALTLRIDDFENRLSNSNMTVERQNIRRELVNSAVVQSRLSGTIRMIIMEEVAQLYSGLRSPEDTARIIQNRVQRYIDERR
ncbi:MAG: extracellular solute-binding protein [Oscillospiraceae bacterium]|nr:extracellular solute-binding protein [Oscillospiraceae bacterium]